MAFSSLPPELKLNIVEHLDPVPTLKFALTSKEHSELSKDRLIEHAMLTKYSTIQVSYEATFLWDFTKEVLQDPRKGWYVRELNLAADRPDGHGGISEEDRILFKAAAENLLHLYPYELGFFATEDNDLRELGDALDHSIIHGFEDAIIVILIHHLPQLRIFRMADTRGGDCFMTFMRRVAAGYQNPALASQMPLQNLRTVAIAHNDTELFCSIDWAVYFLCIPSLRTLAAFMMGSEGVGEFHGDALGNEEAGSEAHLRTSARAPVSNVEELLLYNCRFDPQSFNTILPLTRDLKKFCYRAGGHHVSYQDYEARKVIKALSNHASNSLQELQLTEHDVTFEESEDDMPFVSARGFTKLEALHCEMRWLLPLLNDDVGDDEALSQGFHAAEEEAEDMRDPTDNLPESLKYLHLDGVYEFEEWKQLVDIFRTTNANTPKLTLDNTCIMCGGETSYGRAVEPEVKFAAPHLEEMLSSLLLFG